MSKGLNEEIPVAELGALTELDVSYQGIADLTGIEYCVNLIELSLNENQTSDISPMANLTRLTSLQLDMNQISDISPAHHSKTSGLSRVRS